MVARFFDGAKMVCCKNARITQLENHNFRDKQFESLWFCMDIKMSRHFNFLIYFDKFTFILGATLILCYDTLDANSFLDRHLLDIMWLSSKKCSARVKYIISSPNSQVKVTRCCKKIQRSHRHLFSNIMIAQDTTLLFKLRWTSRFCCNDATKICGGLCRGWLIVRFIRRDCSLLKTSSVFKIINKLIQTIIARINRFAKDSVNR